jgi:hypothetical protein
MLNNIREQIASRQRLEFKRWQDELKALKLAHIKKTAPNFYEASGGDKMKIKMYTDKTANGLTACIVDYLNFSGHYANRINTQGQARVKKIPKYNIFSKQIEHMEKVSYTKSSTRKGTGDIDSIVFGIPLKIEVKVGRDTQSDDQKEEQNRIERAGGVYYLAVDMQTFLMWFKKRFYDGSE